MSINWKFTKWVNAAASGVRFPPDRQEVCRELHQHLEDHYDDLVSQGLSEEDAVSQTLDAMGDPYIIAPQLAAIHHPFWGYFLQITARVLMIILILCIIPGIAYIWKTDYSPPSPWPEDIYDTGTYDEERIILSHTEPNVSFSSDGYSFTVTEAVKWFDTASAETRVNFRIVQSCTLPWMFDVSHYWYVDAAGWFWAEDSQGNYYYSPCEYDGVFGSEETYLIFRNRQTGPFTHTYEFWIIGYIPENICWLDLHYDRDGRDLVLRIDLSGGDEA